MRPQVQTSLKALILIGMGLFLYSRFANGTLAFYINARFFGFTLLAVVGLILVGLSYRFGNNSKAVDDPAAPHAHAQEDTHDHVHSHGLTWGGVALVMLPILLGIAVPPRPLGASALANRELNTSLNQTTMPGIIGGAAQKASTEMNHLDWWKRFRASSNLNQDPQVIGQEAKVVGFVYQDERYGEGHFLLVRYTVSCCVADASALGLVVAAEAAASLQPDQWVEVSGTFTPSTLEAWQMPVLEASAITPIEIPDQPYLYP
jgi:putative membrane protein